MMDCVKAGKTALLVLATAAWACAQQASPPAGGPKPPTTHATQPQALEAASQQAVPATQPEAPATQPAVIEEPSAAALTVEAIQARLVQAKADKDLEDTPKLEAVNFYKQAKEEITRASAWETKTETHQKDREDTPALLESIKQRLEKEPPRPTTQAVQEDTAGTPLPELIKRLEQAENELKAKQEAIDKLEEEQESRSQRRREIPDFQKETNRQLIEVKAELEKTPSNMKPQVLEARRTYLQARRRALELQLKMFDEELRFYDARSDLLVARRQLAQRELQSAQAAVSALQVVVDDRRQTDIQEQKRQAELQRRSAIGPISEWAKKNEKLAQDRATLDGESKQIKRKSEKINELLDRLTKEFAALKDPSKRVEQSELSETGLRRLQRELTQLHAMQREHRKWSEKDEKTITRIEELQRMEASPSDPKVEEGRVEEAVAEAGDSMDLAAAKENLRQLLAAQTELLVTLRKEYELQSKDLGVLRGNLSSLLLKMEEIQAFLDEHLLWIRSFERPLNKEKLPATWEQVQRGTKKLLAALWNDVQATPALYAIAILAVGGLLFGKRRMRRAILDISQRVSKVSTDAYIWTLAALAATLLMAVTWPLAAIFLAWRVNVVGIAPDAVLSVFEMAQATSAGLQVTALFLLTAGFARHVCRHHGLAQSHFRWEPAAIRQMRRHMTLGMMYGAPLVFLVYATEAYSDPAWRATLGRAAYICGMIAGSVLLQRLLRPSTGIFAKRLHTQRSGALYRLRSIWYPLSMAIPFSLAAASFVGYHYSAIVLTERLAWTVWLCLGVLFIHAMLVRWLLVAQRKLALEQARRRKEEEEARREEAIVKAMAAGAQAPSGETIETSEASLSLVDIGEQTRSLLHTLAAIGLLLGLWSTWADMLPALSFLNEVQLSSYIVETVKPGGEGDTAPQVTEVVHYITLAHVLLAILITTATVISVRNIAGLLEITLLRYLPLDTGSRYAITALARYILTTVGIVLALQSVGVGWDNVQWLIAAMTLGLGFGLQEIFANFVSGIMLLFEQPIRVGDTVTVGGVSGTVSKIRIRATTIVDGDRKELVIPNKEFITGQVVNWTLSDQTQRVVIPVGIAYGSNVELAERVLYQVAAQTKHVLAEPKPQVFFVGFGDNALNFQLRAFVGNVDIVTGVKHAMNMAIDREFRKAGIEMAFPQRDLHIRSIQGPVRIVNERPEKPDERPSDAAPGT